LKKRIFISGNSDKPGCEESAKKMEQFLKDKADIVGVGLGLDVTLPDTPIDLLVCLGGDGSFLNLVDQVIKRNIPILGINFGRLGFLTAGLANEMDQLLQDHLEDKTEVFERLALKIESVAPDGSLTKVCHALNDVVVATPNMGHVVNLYVKVSGEPLFHFRGDGMVISTPTGSTGHSLSAGGSLVDPQVEALLLTPLSPQSLSSRPILVRPNATIEVGVSRVLGQAQILYDGKSLGLVKPGDVVRVSRSEHNVKMVQPKDFRFFNRLSDKLGWSEGF
jgi:NAD+ kinase